MDNELLTARVGDIADIVQKTNHFKFLGFLSLEEAVLCDRIISKRNVRFSFFGGYEGAVRVVMGCFPDWAEDIPFPITPITFTYRKSDVLRHRDFLGAILSLGLKRETVGDILIGDGYAIVFVLDEICDFVISQIDKVARVGVTLKKGCELPLPKASKLSEFSATVSSDRLDCVVGALCGFSRSQSLSKIEGGFVSLNSQPCEKSTKTVFAGDAVTVRGIGKFIIDSISDKTRKGRIVLKYKKYV